MPPAELYAPSRRNSAGRDLSDPRQWQLLTEAIAESRRAPIDVRALTAADGTPSVSNSAAAAAPRAPQPIVNPAEHGERIGWVHEATSQQIEQALQAAVRAADEWANTPVATRAALLERAAELYQADAPVLIALSYARPARPSAMGS